MSEVKKCRRPCQYRSSTPSLNGCDFYYLTHEPRGCPAGDACTRFKEGPRINDLSDPMRLPVLSMQKDIDTIRYSRDRIYSALERRRKNHM